MRGVLLWGSITRAGTHTAPYSKELAGTHLSTSQVLQEHHRKGVDWGSHEDRALY